MAISKRISREELVLMYEFAVNQLTAAHEEIKEIQYGFNIQVEAYINLMEENKKLKQDVARIDTLAQRIIYKADGIYPMGIDDIREIACAWIIESLQEVK